MKIPDLPIMPIPPSREVHPAPKPALARLDAEVRKLRERRTDAVSLSDEAQTYEAGRTLAERTVARAEEASGADEAALDAAGRERFAARFEQNADFSPNGAAELILDGLGGHVRRAFENERGSGEESAAEFRALAKASVERGRSDTEAALAAEGADGPAARHATDRAVELVRSGLDRAAAAPAEPNND